MKRSVLLVLALVLGALAAREAQAHIVPVGVGTQTWIEIRPRKLVVRFNLGFSSFIGGQELRLADTNKDMKISAEEEEVYLAGLAKRVLPKLQLHLDGKPVALRLLHSQAAGMRGDVDAVTFDTFFDLEADVPPAPGPHELVYYEGTYENEVSQQILYVINERADDFASFDLEQKTQGPPPVDGEGAITLQGRDVTVRYEFLKRALERDKAQALIEPSLAGLQATLDGLATTIARSTEKDLALFPAGEVRLGVAQPTLLLARQAGFNISAPVAKDRDKPGVSGLTKLRTDETEETRKMKKKMREPFTIAALLLFLLWGAIHAWGPGHGKTMVAAYLLGTKGRIWDAVRLGLIVTFTHTFTLYTFGLGLVYFVERLRLTTASQDAVYRRAVFLLTLLSGIGLFFFGLVLAWRRQGALGEKHAHDHEHAHGHDHAHDHGHVHLPEKLEAPKTGRKLGLAVAAPVEVEAAPAHSHSHDDGHEHGEHVHSHGGIAHSHSHEGMDEDAHAALHAREAASEITSLRDLLGLGIAGGIVPCPAGVTLIIGAIAYSQSALKTFVYLNAFSVGLGAVLVATALLMVFSRSALDRALASKKKKKTLALLPILSAMLVALVGLGIAYEAFDPNYSNALKKLEGLVASSAPSKPGKPAK